VSTSEGSDETGIVIAGKTIDGRYFVLGDVSGDIRLTNGRARRPRRISDGTLTGSWPGKMTAATWSRPY
jgi:hypothetical protein